MTVKLCLVELRLLFMTSIPTACLGDFWGDSRAP